MKNILELLNTLYSNSDIAYQYINSEPEHSEYNGHCFKLNKKLVKFRTGKITPIKSGCFTTLWKRNCSGVTIPHDLSDPFDLYIFHVSNVNSQGQFIFTKEVLAENGIISAGHNGGKRGFRIYPPWGQALNKQAQKTQLWQKKYYFDISHEKINIQGNINLQI